MAAALPVAVVLFFIRVHIIQYMLVTHVNCSSKPDLPHGDTKPSTNCMIGSGTRAIQRGHTIRMRIDLRLTAQGTHLTQRPRTGRCRHRHSKAQSDQHAETLLHDDYNTIITTHALCRTRCLLS